MKDLKINPYSFINIWQLNSPAQLMFGELIKLIAKDEYKFNIIKLDHSTINIVKQMLDPFEIKSDKARILYKRAFNNLIESKVLTHLKEDYYYIPHTLVHTEPQEILNKILESDSELLIKTLISKLD